MWIDCEMTGLDLVADALVEVAVLVTDAELNVLGDGVDVVIKPSDEALAQMGDFVRTMHTSSGLLDKLAAGTTMAEAEEQVLAYVKEHVPEARKAPLAGNTIGTDRAFLARDMPTPGRPRALPQRGRLLVQGAGPPLVSADLLPHPGQERQPSRPGRHPRVDRGAALLPRRAVRPAARARTRRPARRSPPGTRAP